MDNICRAAASADTARTACGAHPTFYVTRTAGTVQTVAIGRPAIAAAVVAPLLALFIILVGVIAAFYLAVIIQGAGPGSYWQSFGSFASQRDLLLGMIKASIFGVIISVIGCQRGLEAKGGPRGVADGVNATVVVSTVGIIGVNFIITLIYTVFFPLQIG
ncbi:MULTISPECIES: ABC transporter permease [unclassified Gordonia (in: high G+C Gram-positive bacteria)]